MPEPKRSPAENLPLVPVATVVVGLLAGSWLLFQPLISSRPTAPLTGGKKGMSIQDVEARLWQDPLQPLINAQQAAATAAQESESAYDKRTHSIDELLTKFFNGDNNKRLILAVMVNGSGYAEKVERRLRDRVAVESALGRAGYFPNDAEHLGYFTIPWPRSADDWSKPSEYRIGTRWDCQNDADCTLLTVPFEEHQRDPVRPVQKRQQWDNILVIWLRQDFFDEQPLTRLAQLLSPFRAAKTCDIRVLGPDTSDSLLGIVDEVTPGKMSDAVTEVLNGVRMFAFRPSASDQILLRQPAEPGNVAALIQGNCPGLRFYRTTKTDGELLTTVVEELRRRNVRLPPKDSPSDTIAVVSEEDTLFARASEATLLSVLPCGEFSSILNDPSSRSILYDCRKHIEYLSYLRGIDGRTPVRQTPYAYATSGTVPSPTPGSSPYNTTKRRGTTEQPEGTDQSDYIRRLAKRISSLDDLHSLLDDQRRSRGITAVGVLGSDVYDKLEILHALHSRLRPKVFFTTGLDARFYHPDELTATRNLVVVSDFGLRLHSFYQGAVPPFRDHDQTAAFAAALCALDIIDPNRFINSKPRIYEISTNGPIDLSIDNRSDLDELREATSDKEPTSIHPGRPDLRNWWMKGNKIDCTGILLRLMALAFFVTGIGYACYSIWGPSRETKREPTTPQEKQNINEQPSFKESIFIKSTVLWILIKSTALWIILSLLSMVLALLYYNQRSEGEPFNLFSSASMWPTEGIRLLVVFLSIHFVVKSLALLKENAINDIKPTFRLDYRDEKWLGLANWLRTAHWHVKETFWVWKHDPNPKIRELWKEYCLRDSPASRLAWTAFWSIASGLIILCLWPVSRGSVSPVRGPLILHLDQTLNVLAMAASTFLTFFVAYATGLDARFALLLNNKRTIWPEEIRKLHQFDSDERAEWTDWNDYYLDVLLIARRTRAVTHLIYYPFITISLLILCRLPQFDGFDWPPLLIAFFSFNILVPSACVFVLRRVAERVRKESLKRLRVKKLREARAGGSDVKREAIETTIAEVKKLDTGIFAPITRQPAVGALLLPFGSAGISALVQFFH